MKVLSHSVVSNSAIPWIIARQPPLFMTFPRQEYWRGKKKRERERTLWPKKKEYWNGLPFPSPGDLLDPGISLTQGSNPSLLNCRQILYRLSQDV